MPVIFETEGVEIPLALKEEEITRWINEVAASHQKEAGDLTYIFCSDEEILKINNQYLQHDYYTDIITFDYTEDNVISGDIFISLDTVKSNSEELGIQYWEELLRVMIHGILHLCGFGDHTDEEEKKMRDLEDRALDLILNR